MCADINDALLSQILIICMAVNTVENRSSFLGKFPALDSVLQRGDCFARRFEFYSFE